MDQEAGACVFCDIALGRAPAQAMLSDELSLCILDINPCTVGHCLVIPRRHEPWWHDLSEAETVSLFTLARRASLGLMKTYGPDFVCLYARGRRIPHTHLFLVPTREGDVLDGFFNALERFQEAPAALAALKDSAALAQAAERVRQACRDNL